MSSFSEEIWNNSTLELNRNITTSNQGCFFNHDKIFSFLSNLFQQWRTGLVTEPKALFYKAQYWVGLAQWQLSQTRFSKIFPLLFPLFWEYSLQGLSFIYSVLCKHDTTTVKTKCGCKLVSIIFCRKNNVFHLFRHWGWDSKISWFKESPSFLPSMVMGDQARPGCDSWHTPVPGAFDFPAQAVTYSFTSALTGPWHNTQHQDLNLHFWIGSISLSSSDTKPVIRSNNGKEIPWLIWLWWLNACVLNYLPLVQTKTELYISSCVLNDFESSFLEGIWVK